MAEPKYVPNRRRSLSDPLSAALIPPDNETAEEREERIRQEEDAKKISDGIDEMIRTERNERKKKKADVKVLLLGQSESGKSTTLKQFQLLYAPSAFHAERIAWRAVIYLNLVRSVRRILDAIAPESDDEIDDSEGPETASTPITPTSTSDVSTKVDRFEVYRSNLEPLEELEERLIRLLSSPDEEEATRLGPVTNWRQFADGAIGNQAFLESSGSRMLPSIQIPTSGFPMNTSPTSNYQLPSPSSMRSTSSKNKEVAVHTTTNWKKAFSLGNKVKNSKGNDTGEIAGWWEDPDDPVHLLNACSSTMIDLWKDPSVKAQLADKRIRLEESSGFYLDEIWRITAKKYFPTDEDVLKARLKTLGVVEHSFFVQDSKYTQGMPWKIYDVGGARNQRQAWAPYFDDVNAVIYLAPISAFDQVLAEDPRVNRLEDAFLLWKSLVSNKLLANVNLILFLNKCDLLRAKLNAGVHLKNHMVSYGDGPNDYEHVSKYFGQKFTAMHRAFASNSSRELYVHFTAVTDTSRTATIIANVRDIIVKTNLKEMRLV